MSTAETFIHEQTKLTALPHLPEIKLHLAEKMEPLWKAIEAASGDPDCPPPFWAFAWAGGQGLARYILDHPETVLGLRVLDFASGCGVVALAAAKAGAKKVWACDIDPLAQTSIQINAQENDVKIEDMAVSDFKRVPKDIDVILAGDVCYEHLMAHRTVAWLRLCALSGIKVFMGDPGRAYVPEDGVTQRAVLTVPTSLELEDGETRNVIVLELTG
jgi:predicted nicotinamide N-methyase